MPEIKFNTKIYKKEAVQEAISVYSNRAKFSLFSGKKYMKVKIDRIDSGIKAIMVDEFANYVLGMTKACL